MEHRRAGRPGRGAGLAVAVTLVTLCLGCRTPAGRSAAAVPPVALTAAAEVPLAAEPLYTLPPPPPSQPLGALCAKDGSALPPDGCTGFSTFSLASVVLSPVPGGPRIALKPRGGVPRGVVDFITALDQHGADLRSCYAWARVQKPALAGALTVQLTVGPEGEAERVTVTAEAAAATPLAQCIEESLAGLRVASVTCRRTTATLRLLLATSPQAPLLPALPRPRFVKPEREREQRLCLRCPEVLPTDDLQTESAVLRIPDLSCKEDLADELNYQAALQAWNGRSPRPARVPIVTMFGQAKIRPALSAEYVGSTIRANLGAYRQCYREALQRTPGLTGALKFYLTLPKLGEATAVRLQEKTVSDAELVQCLTAALSELWFEPGPTRCRTFAEVPFELQPELLTPELAAEKSAALPLQIEAQAEQWLRLEAGEPALRHYSALIRHVPTHPRACYFYLGALRAVMLEEPWAGEATLAAVAALAGYTRQHPDAPAVPACLTAAAPLLTSLARLPAARVQPMQLAGLRELVVARYRLLLDWAPPLPEAALLRFELAETLLLLRHDAEAVAEYKKVIAADPASPLGQKAQQQLAQARQLGAEPPPFAAAPTRPSCWHAVHRPARPQP